MASIKEVARRAGVSPGTVSNTLHNPEKVSPATRQRVETAIRELSFRPDPSAQSVRQGRCGIIGAMLPHDYSEVITPLLLGAIKEAAFKTQTILVSPPYDTLDSEKAALSNLMNKPIDALLYMPRNVDVQIPEFEYLRNLPIVGLIRRDMDMNIPSVYLDSRGSAYQATRYLLSLGRERIAFVCGIGSYGKLDGPAALIELAHSSHAGLHIAADRLLGYEQALHEAGMELRPDLIFFSDFTIPGGERVAHEILAAGKVDAILADSDFGAYGMIRFIERQGFDVPEEISIIGYGNDDIAELCIPGITSLSRNVEQIGRIAVQLVNRMLRGEKNVESQSVPSSLIVRASTKKKSF